MKTGIFSIIFLSTLFLSSLAVAEQTQGQRLAWSCFACHGVNGASQGPATPVIAGLSYNYLVGAMLSYKHAADLDKALDVIDNNPDLEDVYLYKRFSAVMKHVAAGYNLDEIKALAKYFSEQNFVRPQQDYDKEAADDGKKLHKKYCDKCHEDWGKSTKDDVGLLAGQWKTYLRYTLEDFNSGDRGMYKKMRKKMEKMIKRQGEDSLQKLIEFYSSQR